MNDLIDSRLLFFSLTIKPNLSFEMFFNSFFLLLKKSLEQIVLFILFFDTYEMKSINKYSETKQLTTATDIQNFLE